MDHHPTRLKASLCATWLTPFRSEARRYTTPILQQFTQQPASVPPVRARLPEGHLRAAGQEPPFPFVIPLPNRFWVPVALLLHLLAVPQLGAQAPDDSVRIGRIAALGKLWVAIRHFHPWLAYRPIDWDAALVSAIPRVTAGADRAAYRAAVDQM